jgi:hypothetical protein
VPEPSARVEPPSALPARVEEPPAPAPELEPPTLPAVEPEAPAPAAAEEPLHVAPSAATVSAPAQNLDLDSAAARVGKGTPSWMPKALAAFALLVILEAGAIVWLWNRSAAVLLRAGELSVQSRPAAARVTLDDDDLGVTPVTVRLSPGTYTLKVQAGNAEPRVIVVQIRAGVQTAQYLELQTGR